MKFYTKILHKDKIFFTCYPKYTAKTHNPPLFLSDITSFRAFFRLPQAKAVFYAPRTPNHGISSCISLYFSVSLCGFLQKMGGIFMLKLRIVGSESQVGKAILSVLDPMEPEVLCTDKEALDITETEAVRSYGEINRPDIIINCAAITDTKLCEAEPELAYRVNALGARNLSLVARKHNAKIVQLSTDDVFNGHHTKPYTEFDDTIP